MTEEDFNRLPYPSAKKKQFYKMNGHLSDSEVLKELLYYNSLQLDKMERTRSNTSTLVWWLIALPIILGVLIFFMGASAMGM